MKKPKPIGGKYKWDVAISLLSEDLNFAESLFESFGQFEMNIFLYNHNQKDIANKSGIEVFKKTFRSDARVVVLLYREKYGTTKYTRLEHTAIKERFLEEGADFCVLVPLDGTKPDWFPEYQIYTNGELDVKDIADLITHKVMERGGELKEKSFEDYIELLLEKRDKKLKQVQALANINNTFTVIRELEKMQEIMKSKVAFIQQKLHIVAVGQSGFNKGYFEDYVHCNRIFLRFVVTPDSMQITQRRTLPNGITLLLEIFKDTSAETGKRNSRRVFQSVQYKPSVNEEGVWGWANFTTVKELDVLIPFYDDAGFCFELEGYYRSEDIMENVCKEFIMIVANSTKI